MPRGGDKRALIVKLLTEGYSVEEIMYQTKKSESTIFKVKRELRQLTLNKETK